MKLETEVVIVGAGPYGLSAAAHLKARGVPLRIFGKAMQTWREHMPLGMLLKSDGFASNLSAPGAPLTLKKFCAQRGIAYDDTRIPVHLETFTDYGLAFQQQFVPELDERQVTRIERISGGFAIRLQDGEIVNSRAVVLAVGITHFPYLPPELSTLSGEFVSHSSLHREVSQFCGRKVTVLGGGASAIDLAALLHESGCTVSVVSRRSPIRFHDAPGPGGRSLWRRLRHPGSAIGPGLRSRLYTDAPGLFHHLPESVRLQIVRRHLGPASGWAVKQRVAGRIPLLEGYTTRSVQLREGKVHLTLRSSVGAEKQHVADHLIAATGYKTDLRRLTFLSESLLSQLRSVDQTPMLSPDFESSVPGLHFVGLAGANNFGPLLRFACGADFAATRLARALGGKRRSPQPAP